MNAVVIGLGSNIQPEKNIASARQLIKENFNVTKETQFLRLPAIGNTHQPDFLNGAMLVQTQLDQIQLKAFLKDIEKTLGRTSSMVGNNARTIDIDIHVWNNKVVDPYFYKWEFLRNFIFELTPDCSYNHAQVSKS